MVFMPVAQATTTESEVHGQDDAQEQLVLDRFSMDNVGDDLTA